MLRTPLLHLGVAALAMAEAVSKEQKKKGPKLSKDLRIRRQLDAFGAGRLVWKSWLEPTRTSQLCSCQSGKPFAWPMSQKGSLVNSEERLATLCQVNACRIFSSPQCSCRHVPLAHAPCAQPTMAIHKHSHRLLSLGTGQASRSKRSCSKPRRVLDGRHVKPSGCNDEHFEEMFEQFQRLSDCFSTLSSTGWFSPFTHQSDATSRAHERQNYAETL